MDKIRLSATMGVAVKDCEGGICRGYDYLKWTLQQLPLGALQHRLTNNDNRSDPDSS
jgi:hypothetical protein